MTVTGRGWIAAGVCLDLIGAALVVSSLPERGPLLIGGVSGLAAGSFLVFQGVLRLSRRAKSRVKKPDEPQLSRWKPEPELMQPLPRCVELSRRGKRVALAWVLITVVVPAYVYFALSQAATMPEAPQEYGVRTMATIHRKDIREGSSGRQHYLYYRFHDENGNGVRSSVRVSAQVYDSYVVDDQLEVVYLPEDPFSHRLLGLSHSQQRGRPLAELAALASAILLGVTFEAVRRRQKRLTAYGAVASGAVETMSHRGNTKVYRLTYTVGGHQRTLRGSERNTSLDQADSLTVLYRPQKPQQALIYRQSLYRAVESSRGSRSNTTPA